MHQRMAKAIESQVCEIQEYTMATPLVPETSDGRKEMSKMKVREEVLPNRSCMDSEGEDDSLSPLWSGRRYSGRWE